VVGVAFGALGAGLVGAKMLHRLDDVYEFEFDMIDCSPGLPVTIGIPGWLEGPDDSSWKVSISIRVCACVCNYTCTCA
jgi:hypothetical protein